MTPDGKKLPASTDDGPVPYYQPLNFPANFERELREHLLYDYDHDDEYHQDEYFGEGYSIPPAYERDDYRYTSYSSVLAHTPVLLGTSPQGCTSASPQSPSPP